MMWMIAGVKSLINGAIEDELFCHLQGNKLLNKMGLSLLGNIVGNGHYKPPVPKQARRDTYNFRELLHRVVCHMSKGEELEKKEEECLRKLGADCAAYLNRKAYDSSSYAQVVSTLTGIVKSFGIPQVRTFKGGHPLCGSVSLIFILVC